MGESARLTPTMRSRKLQALDFIKSYFARWGKPPSLGELAAELGISRQRAHELVAQLSDEEQIRRVPGKARGIELLEPNDEIGQAELLVRLARLGFIVADGERIIRPPLTETGLPLVPELDHDPDRDIGAGFDDGVVE